MTRITRELYAIAIIHQALTNQRGLFGGVKASEKTARTVYSALRDAGYIKKRLRNPVKAAAQPALFAVQQPPVLGSALPSETVSNT